MSGMREHAEHPSMLAHNSSRNERIEKRFFTELRDGNENDHLDHGAERQPRPNNHER
jgi:hypothetical protein